MNSDIPPPRTGLAYVIGIVGAFLIVAALVWAMRRYTQPTALDKDRAATRAKALLEMRGADKEALENVAWLNETNGIVRLRIDDAMKLVERAWQNPPAARSNLLERVAKANPPPPKPPPSPFE